MSSDGAETEGAFAADSLVLVKGAEPGVVQRMGGEGKYDVLMPTKKTRKIKEKDMKLLHPGPVRSWELMELQENLAAPKRDVKSIFEQLSAEGGAFTIEDLSTLLFSDYKHTTAWATWKLVQEDVYFHGEPDKLYAYPVDRVKNLLAEKRKADKLQKEQDAFLKRIKDGALTAEDHDTRLGDVVDLALGRAAGSALLKELGMEQSAENAHRMLLEWGHWDERVCPWPERCGVRREEYAGALPAVRNEQRRDMTNMQAFAIDPESIHDPDDAISLAEDGKVWVHISDVASCVAPASELDLEARRRGSSAYLPDGCVSMIPWDLTQRLAVGIGAESNCLSVGFKMGTDRRLTDIEVVKSVVKATRMTYTEAQKHIETGHEPLNTMLNMALAFRDRREMDGAAGFQMPDAEVVVDKDGGVTIHEVPMLSSNELVMEFMLMAGEAIAEFAQTNDIPFVYSSQPPPQPKQAPPKKQIQKSVAAAAKALERVAEQPQEDDGPPRTLAQMFNMRKRMQRSSIKTQPEHHHGLGMSKYTQFTSPLRRYGDLVAHQQIRAFLDGKPLMSQDELLQRIEATEEATTNCRKAERMSKQHWSLVWLARQKDWEGEAICVDIRQNRPGGARIATVMIPEICFFCNVKLKKDVKLDNDVHIQLHSVRLPELRADMLQKIPPAVLYGSEEADEIAATWRSRKNLGTRLDEKVKRAG